MSWVPVCSIAWGLGMGATAVVARRTGEKNKPGARVAAAQSVLIALLIGLALAVPAVIWAPEMLVLIGAGEDVRAVALPFTRLMLASNLIIMLLFVVNAVFRGAGNARMALRTLALANGINIVLDPLLIFGVGFFPELGVFGAAVATCTGRTIGVLYQLYHLTRKGGPFAIRLPDLRPVRDVLVGIIKNSMGGMGQILVASTWMVRWVPARPAMPATASHRHKRAHPKPVANVTLAPIIRSLRFTTNPSTAFCTTPTNRR